jgi:hypothetical protein
MNFAAPESVWAIEPRSILPSHTRVSSSSATPGWAAIQSRSRVSKPGTSGWASSKRKVESDGDLPKSVPSTSLSVWRWRLANRSIPTREPWPLRIAKIATSSIHHWGKRIPRRIRQSGSALRKLIRSLAAAGVVAGWEAKGQVRFPRTTP